MNVASKNPNQNVNGSCGCLSKIDRSTGTLQILFYLSIKYSCSKYELRRNLDLSQDAIEGSLNTLFSHGLVFFTEERSFPFAKNYQLSDKGMALVISPLTSWPNILLLNSNKSRSEDSKPSS